MTIYDDAVTIILIHGNPGFAWKTYNQWAGYLCIQYMYSLFESAKMPMLAITSTTNMLASIFVVYFLHL